MKLENHHFAILYLSGITRVSSSHDCVNVRKVLRTVTDIYNKCSTNVSYFYVPDPVVKLWGNEEKYELRHLYWEDSMPFYKKQKPGFK